MVWRDRAVTAARAVCCGPVNRDYSAEPIDRDWRRQFCDEGFNFRGDRNADRFSDRQPVGNKWNRRGVGHRISADHNPDVLPCNEENRLDLEGVWFCGCACAEWLRRHGGRCGGGALAIALATAFRARALDIDCGGCGVIRRRTYVFLSTASIEHYQDDSEHAFEARSGR